MADSVPPPEDFQKKLAAQARQMRTIFLTHLRSPEFWSDMEQDPESFHEALGLAKTYNFVHYTRIAAVMKMKDSSAVSRWFAGEEARKTPEWVRRQSAIQALMKILAYDIYLLQNGKEPIGHKSIKEHEDTGVTLFDATRIDELTQASATVSVG
ncbi:hypothetical protein ABAC460_00625 [Asticcacaulis sp. AC460]|uniref:hypothetical protein n=1 Tax=Asticcacaulis sp. AC460 TaxID=1282360 RepID=UPI0003C3C1FD|nr:hypothetical protein [Asticcacaulis sp. AC460]ESQ93606.1 hypothetical protein ABAC460_00625 [Asticcacaulis sp. AC460]